MKKTLQIWIMLWIAVSLFACKKNNDDTGGNTKSLIKGVIRTYSNAPPTTLSFSYDGQGRNTDWTYESGRVSRQVIVGSRTLTYQLILNSKGLAVEVYSQSMDYNYRRKITYDDKNRIIKLTIDEQQVNGSGLPTTNYQLTETYDFTWDGQSNITSTKYTYTGNANTGGMSYRIFTYSGFSSQYPNGLKMANIGLDFFGPYGYPRINVDGGGNGIFVSSLPLLFAGSQLPTACTSQSFDSNGNKVGEGDSYNYTYEKDGKNRISAIVGNGVTDRITYE